jgi:hypothetical protein
VSASEVPGYLDPKNSGYPQITIVNKFNRRLTPGSLFANPANAGEP